VTSTLCALAGFLGSPQDWLPFGLDLHGIKIDQFPVANFGGWASDFNASIEDRVENPILLGYSLGGRLGLHAIIQAHSLWKGGIIVSTHPGLSSRELKKERLLRDLGWAKRFREEAWDTLMKDWEGQEVFNHDVFAFERKEADCCRVHLSACLDSFSLGRQEDLSYKIKELPMPILWIIGEKDQKLREAAAALQFTHPSSSILMVKEAGHRVPWVQPDAFRAAIENFLQKIS
jgi:2-succinyl-6-hydroxy-2,4-cyclohexadiene-1-carboxylate synthase